MPRPTVDAAIAIEIGLALHAVEEKFDAAMQETARFTAQLLEARQRAGLSAVIGQDVLESVTASLGVLTQARRDLVRTHNQLAVHQRRVGLGHVMISPTETKPTPAGGGGVTSYDVTERELAEL